ncbi:MAG: hypothetical protein ACNA8W_06615 [Bradymonadaceae bacterium]
MKPSWILFSLFLFSLALLSGTACSSTSPRPEASPLPERSVSAAAQTWDGAALHLPAGSPMVAAFHLEELFKSARSAMDWVAAEPEMFGPRGAMLVGVLLMMWQENVREMGQDPLTPAFWEGIGLDVGRPIHAGFYPITGTDAERFVKTFEQSVFDHVHPRQHDDLIALIHHVIQNDDHDVWRGVSAAALRAVEDIRPVSGMRVVVPILDRLSFLAALEEAASDYDFEYLDSTSSPLLKADQHAFVSDSGRVPSFLIRLSDDYALFDVVDREFQPRAVALSERSQIRDRVLSDLIHVIEAFPPGHPAAPQPLQNPILSLSIDQAQVSQIVKLRGFGQALESIRAQSAEARDRHFIGEIYYPLYVARSWGLGSENLPGTAYSLHGRCPWLDAERCILGLEMTLFGADGLPGLNFEGPERGLNVTQRGLGLSVGLELFFDPIWQQWTGIEGAEGLLDAMDMSGFANEELHLFSPVVTLLRSLALFMSNFRSVFLEDEDEHDRAESEEILDAMTALKRIELGSVGLDMRQADWQSRFVLAMIFDPASTEQERELLVKVFQAFLADTIMEALEERAEETAVIEEARQAIEAPLRENALTPLNAPADSSLSNAVYLFETKSRTPYFLLARGLSATEVKQELASLFEGNDEDGAGDDILYIRAEPLALLSALRAWRPHILDPVDLNILVQRLGPMVFSVRPHDQEGIGAIRYLFELQEPPRL